MISIDGARFASLLRVVEATAAAWPGHERAMAKSFAKRTEADLQHADMMSAMVLKLAPEIASGLSELAEDYRFLCEKIILPEEIHFRRTGTYRLTTFSEALETVYNDDVYMTRYMNGLLMSCILWVNHARALQHYAEALLPRIRRGQRLLEIGPGHGLLLCVACKDGGLDVNAWDVSKASLAQTRAAARTLGIEGDVHFAQRDIFALPQGELPDAERFDAIVLSEVLEHLERPREALESLRNLTRPGGFVWVNVPVNSPAPDHIFLLRHPDEARALLIEAGFIIVDEALFAMNDVEIEKAIRQGLTISCAILAQRP